jgi:hypothetical protein
MPLDPSVPHPPKEASLAGLAASIAAGCRPCTKHWIDQARAKGACERGIRLAIETGLVVRTSATEAMVGFAASIQNSPPAFDAEFRLQRAGPNSPSARKYTFTWPPSLTAILWMSPSMVLRSFAISPEKIDACPSWYATIPRGRVQVSTARPDWLPQPAPQAQRSPIRTRSAWRGWCGADALVVINAQAAFTNPCIIGFCVLVLTMLWSNLRTPKGASHFSNHVLVPTLLFVQSFAFVSDGYLGHKNLPANLVSAFLLAVGLPLMLTSSARERTL